MCVCVCVWDSCRGTRGTIDPPHLVASSSFLPPHRLLFLLFFYSAEPALELRLVHHSSPLAWFLSVYIYPTVPFLP